MLGDGGSQEEMSCYGCGRREFGGKGCGVLEHGAGEEGRCWEGDNLYWGGGVGDECGEFAAYNGGMSVVFQAWDRLLQDERARERLVQSRNVCLDFW